AFVTLIAIGKMPSEIALPQRTEDRIGERMRCNVGIRMSREPALIWNLDAAQDQFATLHQWMKVEAIANPDAHRIFPLSSRRPKPPCCVDSAGPRIQAWGIKPEEHHERCPPS